MGASENQSGDRLLWLAAGVVAFMGLTWLVVEAPWSSPDAETLDEIAVAPPEPTLIALEPAQSSTATAGSNPLYMAGMALDAGMLIEPPEYSAWDLYGQVVAGDPDNEEAREGLQAVAAALLRRGQTALEQGRYDDVRTITETIASRLPGHEGARALEAALVTATTPPEPEPAAAPEPEPRLQVAAAEPEPVDPIPALQEAFDGALARNAVLQPAGTSAIAVVSEMLATAPDHALTIAARDLLVTEMLSRSEQSIEALDVQAAQTWIDAAAGIAADPARVELAQERLTEHLIASESQKILPASELTTLTYQAPEFPRLAEQRGLEGWVEVEFVVSPIGETENITVIDASHERFFRDEAIAAVEAWRFEPVTFMGRPIAKRSFTRLEFVFD